VTELVKAKWCSWPRNTDP